MTFTQIPEQYTALGSGAIYVVESPEAADIDLRLVASDGTTCLGMRRYVGVREARCDAAPLLRRALRFEPADDETGFTPAGRKLRPRHASSSRSSTRTPRAAAWPATRPTSSCTTTGAPSAPKRRGRCRSIPHSRSRPTARSARQSTTRTTNRRSNTTACRPTSPG